MTKCEILENAPYSFYEDIADYLVENDICNPTFEDIEEFINNMDKFEIVDAILKWNGIIGYTGRIISLVELFKEVE